MNNFRSTSFTVELHPELPAGNYSIKRIIDIDPLGVWYNYGQETIGVFELTETLTEPGINLEITGEVNPTTIPSPSSSTISSGGGGGGGRGDSITNVYNTYILGSEEDEDNVIVLGNNQEDEGKLYSEAGRAGITGGVIGASLLSGGQLTIIITMLAGLFIVFIVVKSRIPNELEKSEII